jgi:hypothetical protein
MQLHPVQNGGTPGVRASTAAHEWGTQLVVDALRRIVAAADLSGGRVIVVDEDNEQLVLFRTAHSFLPTSSDPLRLYMKVATARRLLGD